MPADLRTYTLNVMNVSSDLLRVRSLAASYFQWTLAVLQLKIPLWPPKHFPHEPSVKLLTGQLELQTTSLFLTLSIVTF